MTGFKCDRCGEWGEGDGSPGGGAIHLIVYTASNDAGEIDLCKQCREELDIWLNREPNRVY